jgi:hypothetical protein
MALQRGLSHFAACLLAELLSKLSAIHSHPFYEVEHGTMPNVTISNWGSLTSTSSSDVWISSSNFESTFEIAQRVLEIDRHVGFYITFSHSQDCSHRVRWWINTEINVALPGYKEYWPWPMYSIVSPMAHVAWELKWENVRVATLFLTKREMAHRISLSMGRVKQKLHWWADVQALQRP